MREAASLLHLLGGMGSHHLVLVGGMLPPLVAPDASVARRGSALRAGGRWNIFPLFANVSWARVLTSWYGRVSILLSCEGPRGAGGIPIEA